MLNFQIDKILKKRLKMDNKIEKQKLIEINNKLSNLQGTMVENINNLIENGESLVNIKNQSDELVIGANNFRTGAHKLNWKVWWQNQKSRFIIGFFILLFIFIIILIIVEESGGFKK